MQKKNKTISIPLFMIIIIFVILIIGIKTICFGNNENISEQEITTEEVANTDVEKNSEKSVLLTKAEEVEKDEKENTQEEIKTNTQETKQENTTKKVTKTYTASDGKKYDTIGIVSVPRLGIEYPILSTVSEKLLKVSVAKYWGGNPNEVGNLCITGHNYKNSKFFGNLVNIKNDDIIKITDLNGTTLDYKVYDTYIVEPENTACTSQLTNGNIEVTLITCYYENGSAHATKRFIVKARV